MRSREAECRPSRVRLTRAVTEPCCRCEDAEAVMDSFCMHVLQLEVQLEEGSCVHMYEDTHRMGQWSKSRKVNSLNCATLFVTFNVKRLLWKILVKQPVVTTCCWLDYSIDTYSECDELALRERTLSDVRLSQSKPMKKSASAPNLARFPSGKVAQPAASTTGLAASTRRATGSSNSLTSITHVRILT